MSTTYIQVQPLILSKKTIRTCFDLFVQKKNEIKSKAKFNPLLKSIYEKIIKIRTNTFLLYRIIQSLSAL